MKHIPYPVLAASAHLLASATPLRTKDQVDPLEMIAKKFGDHVAEVMTKLGATNDQLAAVKEQVAVMAQKAARGGGGMPAKPDTWGETFTKAREDALGVISQERGRTSLEIKATITSATANAAGSAGDLGIPHREQVLGMPKQRMTIRSLLNVVQVSSGSVEYPEQVGRTLNAGMVAEAAAKPSSDLQFAMKTVPIRTIAHWMKASRQVLEDVPQLRDIIDQELIYGLALKEEAQILSGDNTGQNLRGLIPQAAAYNPAISPTDLNQIDVIGLAILQSSLTDVPPDGIVIHPSDWWYMRLSKDNEGNYLLGSPLVNVAPSLFGLPVVPTVAMAARKFLVGSYGSQTLYDRWSARVEVGFENDDFTKNLVTILGEERVGLAAKRPEALIYGDFDVALGE